MKPDFQRGGRDATNEHGSVVIIDHSGESDSYWDGYAAAIRDLENAATGANDTNPDYYG